MKEILIGFMVFLVLALIVGSVIGFYAGRQLPDEYEDDR